jgi:CHAT domain-containing protein/predicted nuclease with TOPRIM domain
MYIPCVVFSLHSALWSGGVTLKAIKKPTRVFRAAVLIWGILACAIQPAFAEPLQAAGNTQEVRPIEVGSTIEREIADVDSHAYRIRCDANAFLRLSLERKNNGAIFLVVTPDNRRVNEISRATNQGIESLAVVSEAAADLQIIVRQNRKDAPAGSYKLTVETLRPATPIEIARKTLNQADLLLAQNTVEARKNALEKYQEARRIASGEAQLEALALRGIGLTYRAEREREKELSFLKQALEAIKKTDDTPTQITIINEIGLTYFAVRDSQNAVDHYQQGLALSRQIKDRTSEAAGLRNLTNLYVTTSQLEEAEKFAGQTVQVWRDAKDIREEGRERFRIGDIFRVQGHYQKAMDYYNQALVQLRASKERNFEAATLNNIALIYRIWGEYQKALDLYNQVVEIDKAIGTPLRNQVQTLNNLGLVYFYLGDPKSALETHKKALEFSEDQRNKAYSLNNAGLAYKGLGDFQKAKEALEQALKIRLEMKALPEQCSTLSVLGELYLKMGDIPKSLELENQAAAICENNNRRLQGLVYTVLGKGHFFNKDFDKAIDFGQRALTIARAFNDRNAEIEALSLLAAIEYKRDNLNQSLVHIEEVIPMIESLRSNVLNPELRASLLAAMDDAYKLHVDVLMELHRRRPGQGLEAKALQVSESARARSLLELLTENRADIRQGVQPELLDSERLLQQRFNEKAKLITDLLFAGRSKDEIAKVNRELDTITAAYQQVQAQIRATSPRYAALTQPQPLTLKEIQEQALDDQTLLLEYSLGAERSYLWAVTPTSINSFILPGREEIEAKARNAYKLLTARNDFKKGETQEQKEERVKQADAAYPQAAAELSRILLAPAASLLGEKRLLIVADGALQYIPFSALPLPDYHKKFKPMVTRHEIISLPSASTIGVLRRDIKGRKAAEKSLAVVADPVFDKQDVRLAKTANPSADPGALRSATNAESRILERVEEEDGPPETKLLRRIKRLPFTRQEANEIADLAPQKDALKLLDFEASREAALSPQMSQYRYVHFASHGYINTEQPMLSAIVLSLVDKHGNVQPQGGFLRTIDIFNLNLPADLVVLSACETGLGKEIRGEGLIGLTRGFMYAGAARVVVSLWSVSDRATAELMEKFYKRIFKKELTPSAALRRAQVRMWETNKWRAPYYWAGFVMQGEWR